VASERLGLYSLVVCHTSRCSRSQAFNFSFCSGSVFSGVASTNGDGVDMGGSGVNMGSDVASIHGDGAGMGGDGASQ
jgi:hypothetical protein